MQLKIFTFGIARDITGSGLLPLEMPEGTDIGALKNTLLHRYPRLTGLASLRVAVNAEFGENDLVLRENDEIALIPPVSGG